MNFNRILITGGDGLLGSNLIRLLLLQNYNLRVLLFPGSQATTLDGLNLERVFGNILNIENIDNAMKDCDGVIHIAADTTVIPARSALLRDVNIRGTENMINVALKHKVKRFIHIGSGSSFQFGDKDNPGSETSPFAGSKFGLDYIDSKYEAQLLVQKAVNEQNFPAIIICPTFMIGPYDLKQSTTKMFLTLYQRKLPFCNSGGRNFVFVKDVAQAIVNSLTVEKIGEIYIAGAHNLTYKDFFRIVGEVFNVKTPQISMPNFIVLTFGAISSLFAKIIRRPPAISYKVARVTCEKQFLSAKKAVKELNMPQTDLKVAIQETFDWMKSNIKEFKN